MNHQTFWKKKKNKIKISSADKWFSYYIRLRAIREECYEQVQCVTCKRWLHWYYEAQCGHYMKRGRPLTRFNEQNCHPQCATCNYKNEGEQGKHGLYIDQEYGEGTSQKLVDLSDIRGQKTHTKEDLKDIAKKYRNKAKELAKQKGIDLKYLK